MTSRRPAGFVIDQQRIEAPDFPRPLTWWRGFVPPWATVADGPGGSIVISYTGKIAQFRTLERWVNGWAARFAPNGVTVVDELPAAPPAPAATGAGRCAMPADEHVCSVFHLLQTYIGGQPGTLVEVCARHYRPMITELEELHLTVVEVKLGDLCGLSQTMSGADYGPCTGGQLRCYQVQQVRVDSFMWLCDLHKPVTGASVILPAGHPVLVLAALRDAIVREDWRNPSPRRTRLGTAERRTHNLETAPAAAVRHAEGFEGRLLYRWALPYLREYAALLDPAADLDPVDAAALPFRAEPASVIPTVADLLVELEALEV